MALVQVITVGTWYLVIFLHSVGFFFCFLIGIAEMFAEDGYDLILGFRENVTAAEKFKNQLLQKHRSQNVMNST